MDTVLKTHSHLAAIDAGSNAIRMIVVHSDKAGRFETLTTAREPIRLGDDVFRNGVLSEETIERMTTAFRIFRSTIDRYGDVKLRAVATSAIREAHNREAVIEQIKSNTGISIEVIDGEEEARLVFLAVNHAMPLKNQNVVMIDIGGGSVEVTLSENNNIVAVESFRLGSVRLLQMMDEEHIGEAQFYKLVREYVEVAKKWVKRELGKNKIDRVIGTGGNIEALYELKSSVLAHNGNEFISLDDIQTLNERMQSLALPERILKFKLRPDRADVIIPAAIVLQAIVKQTGLQQVWVPKVGLKDGVLLDLYQETQQDRSVTMREQVISHAMQIGKRYAFDESHARAVAGFAVQLFDATEPEHKLNKTYRLLLETAALLHDIGNFIHPVSHHKHAQYLILSTPLIGLSETNRLIVSNIARYHRKSLPNPTHELFQVLPPRDRTAVLKLAALLRLADSLDREHADKVKTIRIEWKKRKLVLHLEGDGDLLLEKWSLIKKGAMFEQVFSAKIVVNE